MLVAAASLGAGVSVRRMSKVVSKTGGGIVPGSDDLNADGTADADGILAGDRTEHYYYAGWCVVEERDGSGNTLAQTVYGTQYIDEPVCRDRNTDVWTSFGGSADNDCLDSGGSQRYFYHQDANFRVAALTTESGTIIERYDYTAYGDPRIAAGVTGTYAETGAALAVSRVGNPLMHQGMRRDDETGLHENRMRSLHSRLGRFMQRDPLGYWDSLNLLEVTGSAPIQQLDPLGECSQDKPKKEPTSPEDWLKRFDEQFKKATTKTGKYTRTLRYVEIIYHEEQKGSITAEWRRSLNALSSWLTRMFEAASIKNVDITVQSDIDEDDLPGGMKVIDEEHFNGKVRIRYITWVQHIYLSPKEKTKPVAVTEKSTTTIHMGGVHGTAEVRHEESVARVVAHELIWHGMGGISDHEGAVKDSLEDIDGSKDSVLTTRLIDIIKRTLQVSP